MTQNATQRIQAREAACLLPVYGQMPFTPTRAAGCDIVTTDGHHILDFYGCSRATPSSEANMIWLLSGTALVSILISALCTASETATFAIGTSRLRTMQEEGFRGADALADVRGRAEQTRATLLFLNTLFNAVTVGTSVLLGHALWDTSGGVLGLLAGYLAVLIFSRGRSTARQQAGHYRHYR